MDFSQAQLIASLRLSNISILAINMERCNGSLLETLN
jgi:hypothetical protein